MAPIVVGLGVLTVVTMVIDHDAHPMPDSHLTAVPVAVALFVAAWLLDLAGVRLPRLAFAAAVVLPNVWLTAIGHTGPNFLFLLLLAAWVVLTGTRAEGVAALGLATTPIAVGVFMEIAATGRPTITAWASWLVGMLAMWGMARLVVDQQRLVAALRAAQAQARQAAALEERQRLARELHDAVTQTLFSATLTAEVLSRLWKENPDEAEAQLEELRQLTRGALAEMRALLLELRPAALSETPLPALLKQLCAAFTGRARVPADVRVDGECALAPDVQVAFYRLAQEALNNVAKHADAGQVVVELTCRPGRVELRAADDGRGFDPGGAEGGHLGLGIMRERAAAIGAELSVESSPGGGTTVRVVWEDRRAEEQPT